MSNLYLVSSSGMCLPTGVDYKFILLRSSMPDWRELAPALRKFVKLIMENNVYSNEWRVVTMHAGNYHYTQLKIVDIHTIHAESKALIADFEKWSAIRNYLKQQTASQDQTLAAFPQMKAELQHYENNIFTHNLFFDRVFFCAERMFLGREQDDTQNIRPDVMKLREAVLLLPYKKEVRGRDGGYGAQV